MFLRKIIFTVGVLLLPQLSYSGVYHTEETTCDGFPQVRVETMPGTCLGLVIQDIEKKRLKKPRKIIPVTDTKSYLLTDMGGWSENKGKLFLLKENNGTYELQTLLRNLNLPHGLDRGPNNTYLLGEKDKIIEFKIKDHTIDNIRTVVSNLPAWQNHLHPLTHFILDKDNNLIVNTGASSDQCLEEQPNTCTFSQRAGLRLYEYDAKNQSWKEEYKIIASGLRNSMALVVHPSGTMLQAENSMDFKSAAEPYEEINVIEYGKFYGWPYCYNNLAVNSKWADKKSICSDVSQYSQPYTLLPPHVAPLDMLFYNSDLIPALTGKLMMSWHGYRIVGNRIVAYDVDVDGKPILKKEAYFYRDPGKSGEFTKHQFTADGGTGNVAQHIEVTTKWNSVGGVRPEGAPVGMTVADDGSVWVVDDKNQAILRLSKGEAYEYTKTNDQQQNNEIPNNIARIFDKHCQSCHQENDRNSWFVKVGKHYVAEQRIFFDTARPMPPNSTLSPSEKDELKKFFTTLKK